MTARWVPTVTRVGFLQGCLFLFHICLVFGTSRGKTSWIQYLSNVLLKKVAWEAARANQTAASFLGMVVLPLVVPTPPRACCARCAQVATTVKIAEQPDAESVARTKRNCAPQSYYPWRCFYFC